MAEASRSAATRIWAHSTSWLRQTSHPLAEQLHEVLAVSGTLVSASVPSGGLCAVRVLSEKARELYRR